MKTFTCPHCQAELNEIKTYAKESYYCTRDIETGETINEKYIDSETLESFCPHCNEELPSDLILSMPFMQL